MICRKCFDLDLNYRFLLSFKFWNGEGFEVVVLIRVCNEEIVKVIRFF